MKIWLIARGSLVRTIRDKRALALILLMPMILIGILGSALKGMFSQNQINPYEIVVVNLDKPSSPPLPPGAPAGAAPSFHFGKMLIDEVLLSDGVKKVLHTSTGTDVEQARDEVKSGKAVAAVIVPATFSADALAGKGPEIQLVTDPGKPTGADIAAQIVRAFTEGITSGTVLSSSLPPQEAAKMSSLINKLTKVSETTTGVKEVSAMQYYAAAMAIMFMLMTAFGQAKNMIEERMNGTLARMLTSPTGKLTVVVGKILGNASVVLAQFVVLVAGTHFLYGVDWGPVAATAALGTAFSLAAAGIGMIVVAVMKDPQAADASVGIVPNIFAALSGAMAPLYVFPAAMKMAAKAIPNYWALQGFIDQMAGLGYSQLWLPVTVLCAMGLVTGAIGAWRLSWR